jgi:hypothetical protein
VLSPSEVRGVEETASKAVGKPVEVTVRSGSDLLVTGEQYRPTTEVKFDDQEGSLPEGGTP